MDGRSTKGIWKPILTNSKKDRKGLDENFKIVYICTRVVRRKFHAF